MKKKILMFVLFAMVLSLATPSVFALGNEAACSDQNVMDKTVQTQNGTCSRTRNGIDAQSICFKIFFNCTPKTSPTSSNNDVNTDTNTSSRKSTANRNNNSKAVCENSKCNTKTVSGNSKSTCNLKDACGNCNISCDQLQSILKDLNNGTCTYKIICKNCKPDNTSSSVGSNANSNTSSNKTTDTNPQSGYSSFQKRIVELVNEQRTANGLKPLSANSKLDNVATLKSQDMVKLNYFSHTSPTYGSPFDMLKQFGISYRAAGENIAMGQTSPEEVMKGWMNSPGHRANILNPNFTQIGVGVAKNAQGRYYWTQTFIG